MLRHTSGIAEIINDVALEVHRAVQTGVVSRWAGVLNERPAHGITGPGDVAQAGSCCLFRGVKACRSTCSLTRHAALSPAAGRPGRRAASISKRRRLPAAGGAAAAAACGERQHDRRVWQRGAAHSARPGGIIVLWLLGDAARCASAGKQHGMGCTAVLHQPALSSHVHFILRSFPSTHPFTGGMSQLRPQGGGRAVCAAP